MHAWWRINGTLVHFAFNLQFAFFNFQFAMAELSELQIENCKLKIAN